MSELSTLIERLNFDDTTTEADVLRCLELASIEGGAGGAHVMPVHEFWRPEDLNHYRAAVAWWPKDAPKQLMRPYLGVMCNRIARHPPLQNQTFYQDLIDQTQAVCAWITEQGGNPANPNETKEERRRRKGREAVSRHRALADSTDPQVAEVKRLYGAYMEACQARKAAAAEHDENVRITHAAWEQAKAALPT